MTDNNTHLPLTSATSYIQRRAAFAHLPCPYYTPECPEGHCNKYGTKCWFGIHNHNICALAIQQKREYDEQKVSTKLQLKIQKKNQPCRLYPNCRYGTKCKYSHSEEERIP